MSALLSVCWNFLSNLICSFNDSGKKSIIRVTLPLWSCNSVTIERAKVNTRLSSLTGNRRMQVCSLLPYSLLGFFFSFLQVWLQNSDPLNVPISLAVGQYGWEEKHYPRDSLKSLTGKSSNCQNLPLASLKALQKHRKPWF